MERTNLESQTQTTPETPAKDDLPETMEERTSRYDDSFYRGIFGAFEGPPDLARRHKEIFGEIMDEKYRRKSSPQKGTSVPFGE